MDGLTVTDYRERDVAIPVIARTPAEERRNPGDLWNTQMVSSTTGEPVPLTQVADISGEWAFYRINRRNQQRCLTVSLKHFEGIGGEKLAGKCNVQLYVLPGDTDGSGVVNVTDYSMIKQNLFTLATADNCFADVYPDGVFNVMDYSIIRNNYLAAAEQCASPSDEPEEPESGGPDESPEKTASVAE